MALKAYEGFDHYNSGTGDIFSRSGWLQWVNAGNGGTLNSPGANGTGKYISIFNGALNGSWANNLTTFYLGQRFDFSVGIGAPFIDIMDNVGGSRQLRVTINGPNAGVILQSAGGTVLATSNNNVFPLNAWFYLEIGGTIDPAAGSLTVKINGTTVLTFSGNTRTGTTNSYVNGHNYACNGSNTINIDDVYIADGSVGAGTYPMNTFLTSIGDPRVWYGPPNANSSVAFTPLANTNWQEVSEVSMDSDTSYNSSSTVGQADLFTTTGFPTMSVVLAVGVIGAYRKDNSGARNASNELKSGATTANGTSQPLNASYTYYQDFWVEDPNTSASWTVANAQAVTFGYHLDS